jgi:hypothetical protein
MPWHTFACYKLRWISVGEQFYTERTLPPRPNIDVIRAADHELSIQPQSQTDDVLTAGLLPRDGRAGRRWRDAADKDVGYSLLLGDCLRCVNSRQEGKLTHRLRGLAGHRNGEADGVSALEVFVAILDEQVFYAGRNFA